MPPQRLAAATLALGVRLMNIEIPLLGGKNWIDFIPESKEAIERMSYRLLHVGTMNQVIENSPHHTFSFFLHRNRDQNSVSLREDPEYRLLHRFQRVDGFFRSLFNPLDCHQFDLTFLH